MMSANLVSLLCKQKRRGAARTITTMSSVTPNLNTAAIKLIKRGAFNTFAIAESQDLGFLDFKAFQLLKVRGALE